MIFLDQSEIVVKQNQYNSVLLSIAFQSLLLCALVIIDSDNTLALKMLFIVCPRGIHMTFVENTPRRPPKVVFIVKSFNVIIRTCFSLNMGK